VEGPKSTKAELTSIEGGTGIYMAAWETSAQSHYRLVINCEVFA